MLVWLLRGRSMAVQSPVSSVQLVDYWNTADGRPVSLEAVRRLSGKPVTAEQWHEYVNRFAARKRMAVKPAPARSERPASPRPMGPIGFPGMSSEQAMATAGQFAQVRRHNAGRQVAIRNYLNESVPTSDDVLRDRVRIKTLEFLNRRPGGLTPSDIRYRANVRDGLDSYLERDRKRLAGLPRELVVRDKDGYELMETPMDGPRSEGRSLNAFVGAVARRPALPGELNEMRHNIKRMEARFPRTRGDRPSAGAGAHYLFGVPPHTRG